MENSFDKRSSGVITYMDDKVHFTLSTEERIRSLFYAYKYSSKEQFMKTLKTLENVLSPNLYVMLEKFAEDVYTWRC